MVFRLRVRDGHTRCRHRRHHLHLHRLDVQLHEVRMPVGTAATAPNDSSLLFTTSSYSRPLGPRYFFFVYAIFSSTNVYLI